MNVIFLAADCDDVSDDKETLMNDCDCFFSLSLYQPPQQLSRAGSHGGSSGGACWAVQLSWPPESQRGLGTSQAKEGNCTTGEWENLKRFSCHSSVKLSRSGLRR